MFLHNHSQNQSLLVLLSHLGSTLLTSEFPGSTWRVARGWEWIWCCRQTFLSHLIPQSFSPNETHKGFNYKLFGLLSQAY